MAESAFAAALCTYLASDKRIVVSGPHESLERLTVAAGQETLGVLILDTIPASDSAWEELAVGSLILAMGPTDPDQMIQAFSAGAASYVDDDASFEEIADAVHKLVNGEAVVPPSLLGALLKHVVRRRRGEAAARDMLATLTPREREVFDLISTGADNVAIAAQLFISPATVRTHGQRVFRKLDVHSRAEAVSFAIQCGIYQEFPE